MLRNKHGCPLIGLRLFSVALRYLLPFPTCRNLLQLDLTEISQGVVFSDKLGISIRRPMLLYSGHSRFKSLFPENSDIGFNADERK